MSSDQGVAELEREGHKDLNELKTTLLNIVCASMIAEPKFGPEDIVSNAIRDHVREIALRDPEFILKLALYVRDDLNIRSTANFLAALAADTPQCTPYMRKYFKAIVRLPSDWLDIAALYQMLPDRKLQGRALPTCLREAMKYKFPAFDAYQLGKYNKEGKIKRKAKKAKNDKAGKDQEKTNKRGADDSGSDGENEVDGDKKKPAEPIKKRDLTLKQMIRQLHLKDPVLHVMSVLGKKYPLNEEEFYRSKLPGAFDLQRAGRRMKLPIPETWETLLSAKGNKAATWEELIDHKKLPFMAMLRNLRNLILTGVSYKHHSWAVSKLNNEKTIASSRQFPFAFFSAYEAINVDLEKLKEEIKEAKEALKNPDAAKAAREKKKAEQPKTPVNPDDPVRRPKKVIIPVVMPDAGLIKKYRDALDQAVKFATVHNVKPIRGATVVFCNVGASVRVKCNTAKGMGGVRQVHEVGILLGLMCKYMCEECDFQIFSSAKGAQTTCNQRVELKDGTILDNMTAVLEAVLQMGDATEFPFEYIEELIRQRKKIDQFIVLSNSHIAPGFDEQENSHASSTGGISRILKKYRQEVNPDLLYVAVNLTSPKSIDPPREGADTHPNNVTISGFSDAILKYVAERGDGNQLGYIQNIDQAKGLAGEKIYLPHTGGLRKEKTKEELEEKKKNVWSFMDANQLCKHEGCPKSILKEKLEAHMLECEYRPVPCKFEGCDQLVPRNGFDSHCERCLFKPLHKPKAGRFQTAKVFISSTFLDMHGERDALLHKVFAELKERAQKERRVNLYEIDLRWGVTREEAENNKSLEICLSEVDRCRPFFIGLLGKRYGWCPEQYTLPDEPAYEWVKKVPKGRSVTELEMWHGALRNPKATQALFYFREDEFNQGVPDEHRRAFDSESAVSAERMELLKAKIREKCPESVRTYKAKWAGVVDGKPSAGGLEQFVNMVKEDLWRAICATFPAPDDTPIDELATVRDFHDTCQEMLSKRFLGRRHELTSLFKYADGVNVGPVAVVGPPGEGKSALLASFIAEYSKLRPGVYILHHFVGCAPGSTDIRLTMRRLCEELKQHFSISEEVPQEYKELRLALARFLDFGALAGRVLLVIDGLDQFDEKYRAQGLEWLPLNSQARIVVSAEDESMAYNALHFKKVTQINLTPLPEKDQKDMVRQTLWDYRKRLDELSSNNQMRALIKKIDGHKPLFLMIACEELRVFGIFEKVNDRIKVMSSTVPKLLDEVLARLEKEHGKDLMKQALSLLLVARDGLLESEMLTLLGAKNIDLPRTTWAALFRSLQAYLRPASENGESTLDFFHRQMARAVRRRYILRDQELKVHQALAKFFLARLDPTGTHKFEGNYPRAVSELPYHLCEARMWPELNALLCSVTFVEAKATFGWTYGLVEDLDAAVNQRDNPHIETELEYLRFVAANAHILCAHPSLTFQQAANQPDNSGPAAAALALWSANAGKRRWFDWVNKPQKNDACLMTLAGYSEPVLAAAFSPDGSQMVTASRDRLLKVWDAKTGNELATLQGHTNWVVDCKYSPDGRSILSASWDGSLRLWDSETGACMHTLTGHEKRVNACSFSQDGLRVLSASWDCSLVVWDPATGKEVKRLRGHTKPINSCGFSHDGRLIVSASWDGTIRIWDADEGLLDSFGKCVRTMVAHLKSVRSVEFSPNGKHIVSSSVDGTLKVWDIRTGNEVSTMSGHTKPINTVSFSQDGKCLVTASDDQTVKIWDALGGREVSSIVPSDEESSPTCCAFSPDGKRIAGGLSNCNVGIWDTLYGSQLLTLVGHTRTINAVAFSPDGKLLMTAADDKLIKIWDAVTGVEVRTITGHDEGVSDCAWDDVGDTIVSASDDFTVRLWDAKTGAEKQCLRGHSSAVKACAFSPKGKIIASSSKDSTVKLWDLDTGRCRATLQGHMDWINRLAFSADGKKLVTASWDFTLKIWDVRSGKVLHTLTGHMGAAVSCSFSADGRRVASGSFDSTVMIWDVQEGAVITTLNGHTSRVNCVSFSQDGKSVVSSSDDRSIKIWDAVAGSEITTLQGHSGIVRNVRFSPANNQVISASEDCTVKVWNASAPKEQASHSDSVTGVAASADGDRAVSASRDLSVGVWDMEKGRRIGSLSGHTACINACAISADGKKAVTASDDKTVRVWSMQSSAQLQLLNRHTNAVKGVALSPDGNSVASASWDGTVRLWNANTGSITTTMDGHSDWVNCVAYSPNGKLIASASHDNTVRLWDSNGGTKHTFHENSNWMLACSFSADNTRLVAGSYGAHVFVYDVSGSRQLYNFKAHTKRVNSVCFAKANDTVLSAASDGSVLLWDLRSFKKGKPVAQFYTKGHATAIAMAAKNSSVVAGDSLGNMYFFDLM